jgi:hypothetical protein
MPTPARMLAVLVFAALVPVDPPLRAQGAPVRPDTVRDAEFSDRTISRAFGLPDATSAQVSAARNGMRCMDVEDAVLCNLAAPEGSWSDCASLGLVGQFIVWFDLLGGQKTDKRVYVAVECPGQTVTMSSLRRHPVIEFTLDSRKNDSVEQTSRTVVFITTPRG